MDKIKCIFFLILPPHIRLLTTVRLYSWYQDIPTNNKDHRSIIHFERKKNGGGGEGEG